MGESYFIFTVMLHIDEKKLISLLKDFHKLTGIKICVFDEKGTEIAGVPYNYCEFCQYVRSSEVGLKKCDESDKRGFEICKSMGKPYRYTCHMGLVECVMPILRQGNCIGYIMIGQAMDNAPDERFFTQKSIEYGLDKNQLSELYSRIAFSDNDKISASISIMEACAGYVYMNKLIHGAETLGAKIDNYITQHMSEEITVDILCREFSISRVNLYSSVKQAFGETPAEHIKNKRLTEACRLLRESNMKITEIAQSIGISDYNYFSKIFKKEFNMSPREYRKINSAII